ncbi:MAG TPA: metal-dependent transcriptional regulator [bacterium]|nr:metal-dependent transcriptional regulator [bacterium]HOL49900.1 metal-dependent transcriptional regulator [bacterium]HPO52079.1 metal-dependent transcriptional regulator [bacterium]
MDRELEDILEEIWKKRELKESFVTGFDKEKMEHLRKMGLVEVSERGAVLTKQGEEIAKCLVRRHRLWEVFLHDFLGMEEFNEMAGIIEHDAKGNIDEALCDFLGHPQQCPDGKPIPRGLCCGRRLKRRAGRGFFHQMGVLRLCDVPRGTRVKVVCLRGKKFPRLSGYGIVPGCMIYVQETFPGFIIRIDQTEIALDKESCADVLVQLIDQQDEHV